MAELRFFRQNTGLAAFKQQEVRQDISFMERQNRHLRLIAEGTYSRV